VDVNTIRPVTQRLTDGQQVGVVVLINKYDGMDLPDDACRLLMSQAEPQTARPRRATEAQPDRVPTSRKSGSVILPGEGGPTGAPDPMR
jgi:hypothetical protein